MNFTLRATLALTLALPLSAAERAALLIGNHQFVHGKTFGPLPAAVADLKVMRESLLATGFAAQDVTPLSNQTAEQMKLAVTAFAQKYRGTPEVLVYVSSHGLAGGAQNFLAGVDANLDPGVLLEALKKLYGDDQTKLEAEKAKLTRKVMADRLCPLSHIITALDGMSADPQHCKIIILDACRNEVVDIEDYVAKSPLLQGLPEGFAPVEPPSGVFIGFAAKAGQLSIANEDLSTTTASLFTRHFAARIQRPGTLEDIFRDVRNLVEPESLAIAARHPKAGITKQSPFPYQDLRRPFSFVVGPGPAPRPPVPDDPALLAKLVAMEKKLAELQKEGGASKAEADRLKAELAAMSVPSRAVPPESSAGLFDGPGIGKTTTVSLPGGVKLKLCGIPAGSFTMGSPAGEADRGSVEKQVRVTLTKAFWMPATEFTQEQWQAVMDSYLTKSVMDSNPSKFKGADLPVETVSWNEVQDCLKALNSKAPLPAGWKWALPTEAQWEYACRAGTTTAFSFGDTATGAEANFDGNYPYGTTRKGTYLEKTTAVGSYQANAWGLCDMHGNVWEWCADAWDGSTALLGGTDPLGANGSSRVNRGGSWINIGQFCRSAFRGRLAPEDRRDYLGFRPAAVPAGR